MNRDRRGSTATTRLLATTARRLGRSLELDEILDAVACAVVEALGFRAAVVNLLGSDDNLHVVAVAGSDKIRAALLGTYSSRATWEQMLAGTTAWGDLRFLDHRAQLPSGAEDMQFFVPDLPVPDSADQGRWHPEDGLFAPLVGSMGALLGVLSVDDPEDGRLPTAEQTALLEVFAVHASLAIEKAREHKALIESETMLRRMFDESPVGKALFSPDGLYRRVNRAYCEFLGRSPEEFLGRHVLDFVHPDEHQVTARLVDEVRSGAKRRFEVEKRYLHADGSQLWGRLSLTRIGDDEDAYVLTAIEDITAAREAAEQLRHMALHDSLTGLPNRTLILDRLGQALARARREGSNVAVAVIDIDHFKLVNDSHGHPLGDELLVKMASLIQDALRDSDTAARLGGDEFIVVCEGVADSAAALLIAERLRAAVRTPVRIGDVTVLPSASIGCTVGGPDSTPDQLVAEADAAMYRAKSAGRGRFELFDEEMRLRSLAHLELRAQLREAVTRDEFRLHYQPILRLATGEVVGYEALLRWQHPARGLLMPAEFLPVLTDSDLDSDVTRWVLNYACADIAAYRRATGTQPFVSVNLSPRQLGRRELTYDVRAALANAGLPAHDLWLEITEEHLIDCRDRHVIDDLRAIGCPSVLDDFGTGYSGLTYLQQMPVDVLKIDREFINRLAEDTVSAGITAAVTDLAELLQIRVVAEGVETEAQADVLRRMGVGYVQGYYFGRPGPLPAAMAGPQVLAEPVKEPVKEPV